MADIKHVTPEDLGLSGMEKNGYERLYQLKIKRIVDILFSLILLPFVVLIAIPIGIAIKVEDNGPIFYKSRRLGKNFIEYNMIKFRSMHVNAPNIMNADGSTFNSKTDSRVTKIGRIIREMSIDELPQVINVLTGDMSIIGPRAGDIESKDTYTEIEKEKVLVRPGITGYTQAYYRNNLGVSEKRIYDAWYAHNVSFVLDVKIFFRTIKTVFTHENVYTN